MHLMAWLAHQLFGLEKDGRLMLDSGEVFYMGNVAEKIEEVTIIDFAKIV